MTTPRDVWRAVVNRCAGLSALRVLLVGAVAGVAYELLTMASRFGLDVQVTRDTIFMATLTFGLRIHHGYIGVLLLLTALCLVRARIGLRKLICIAGVTLVLSDALHHFVVLPMAVGSTEFHLTYPRQPVDPQP